MYLNLTKEETQFRDEVRAFLASELDDELVFANRVSPGVWSPCDVVLRWQRKLHTKGWVAPVWPKEYGGTDWSPIQHYIFAKECADVGAPDLIAMGVKMVGPVIIKFGTQEQKDYYLPRILNTEDFWCQGFSEPGSGSDLASLKCKAERDGDSYVINGSKIWTTEAHHANKIFCLVRTSTVGKPQAGISFLLMDIDTPGITVTPIISISGEHEVNQVFFDNARVPVDNLVGAEGQGWECTKYLLEFERGAGMQSEKIKQDIAELKRLAAQLDDGADAKLIDQQRVKEQIAQCEIRNTALTFTELRVVDAMSRGQQPGVESSLIKTEFTEIQQAITELSVELLGPNIGQLEARRPMHNVVEDEISALIKPVLPKYLNFRAASIYGGSNEIQRNIIAKMILEL